GVRHVGIQATDVNDVIFLARKIRDVAPDVRLAFFEADSLMLHESFRRDLLGSLVVSPYPFLGTDDFVPTLPLHFRGESPDVHMHMAFENSEAEGTFNAVLASRRFPFVDLQEYAFDRQAPLPMWVSVIGRHSI